MTRYIIIGAGAIGGGIGGRLAQAGLSTVLVARGDHLVALQQRGMRLRSPDADVTVPVRAVGGPEEIGLHGDDVLVVATKTHQALTALSQWADVPVQGDAGLLGTAGDRLPVLMALNGVAGEEMALRYFSRVFGVCVWMPAVHLEPGEVIIRGLPISGMFHIGRVPAHATHDEDRTLLARLASDWTGANFAVTLPDDVMAWKYRKLISNIGNAFQALVGSNGDIDALVKAADAEARQILHEAQIVLTSDSDERQARDQSFTVRPVPGEPTELGGSTWQSLARGTGNVESDYLNGEIAQIAHRNGLLAPINTRMASLARVAAARGQKPGSTNADELARALGLAE
jgi:2-dehydropantoate 2-reductase